MQPARTVDRSIAKMIAYKRLVTAAMGFTAGVALIIVGLSHRTSPRLALAILILWGGGAWALRDGLRLLRDLRR